jgi:hypothetical protein
LKAYINVTVTGVGDRHVAALLILLLCLCCCCFAVVENCVPLCSELETLQEGLGHVFVLLSTGT